jgi:hypothetical protein
VILAHAVPGDQHLIALTKAGICRSVDLSSDVDAARHGEAAHYLSSAGGRQSVLVIDARESRSQEHLALVQVIQGDLGQFSTDATFVIDSVSSESVHKFSLAVWVSRLALAIRISGTLLPVAHGSNLLRPDPYGPSGSSS